MINLRGLKRGRAMRERMLRAARREEGANLIEMALSAVVLFLLLMGLMEMCLGFYAYHATDVAARMGTRWAMVRGSTSCSNTPNLTDCDATAAEIQSYVAGLGYLNMTTSDVTVNWLTTSGLTPATWSTCSTGTCNAPGNQVQVIVTYPVSLHLPLFNHTFNVGSTSKVVISQ
jgi:Flp pilus assembly protein TadG